MRKERVVYFDANTDALELDFERTPFTEVMRLKRLSEQLTKRVKRLKIRLSHDVYYDLARLDRGEFRHLVFWQTIFERFPLILTLQVEGARCGSLNTTEQLLHDRLTGRWSGIIYKDRIRLVMDWLSC
jgi:hypothetical protein